MWATSPRTLSETRQITSLGPSSAFVWRDEVQRIVERQQQHVRDETHAPRQSRGVREDEQGARCPADI